MDEIKRTPWPTCMRATAVFAVILAVLMLAGCQTTKEIVVSKVVERKLEVPQSLLQCAPEPRLTAALAAKLRAGGDSAADVARFVNQLAAAGADCRAKLDVVRKLLATQ